jgi:hypothetical protein
MQTTTWYNANIDIASESARLRHLEATMVSLFQKRFKEVNGSYGGFHQVKADAITAYLMIRLDPNATEVTPELRARAIKVQTDPLKTLTPVEFALRNASRQWLFYLLRREGIENPDTK